MYTYLFLIIKNYQHFNCNHFFLYQIKLTGKELINLVYQYLKLIESDYFGLEYVDLKGKKCWLDYDKSVSKQVQNNSKIMLCVKFYTPDPGQLEEEYTR